MPFAIISIINSVHCENCTYDIDTLRFLRRNMTSNYHEVIEKLPNKMNKNISTTIEYIFKLFYYISCRVECLKLNKIKKINCSKLIDIHFKCDFIPYEYFKNYVEYKILYWINESLQNINKYVDNQIKIIEEVSQLYDKIKNIVNVMNSVNSDNIILNNKNNQTMDELNNAIEELNNIQNDSRTQNLIKKLENEYSQLMKENNIKSTLHNIMINIENIYHSPQIKHLMEEFINIYTIFCNTFNILNDQNNLNASDTKLFIEYKNKYIKHFKKSIYNIINKLKQSTISSTEWLFDIILGNLLDNAYYMINIIQEIQQQTNTDYYNIGNICDEITPLIIKDLSHSIYNW
ncbi:MAG: hypothetical protein IJ848_02530 [Alphaproteobacteria bacterium]|nr:hypothetical protein [Alphaproteobacteria bacterium]